MCESNFANISDEMLARVLRTTRGQSFRYAQELERRGYTIRTVSGCTPLSYNDKHQEITITKVERKEL